MSSSLLLKTDVTSVKLYGHYILAGIGSYIHLYDVDSNDFKLKIRVLNGQKIYGIVPCDEEFRNKSKILIFGGKQFRVIEVVSENSLICCSNPVICADWLHSCVWTLSNNIAVLTAHNIVQTWNTETQSLETEMKSNENSILYSGLLVPLSDGLLVFSGTVFSEVLISCGEERPLHSLKGHKGVIFSISCDLQRGIIVTTSDDRSVRIWNVQNETTLNYKIKEFWKSAKIHPLHELYGHGARVMRNCIVNKVIISIGEDSAVCYWDIQGNLLKKVATHTNACVWSLDANKDFLVTGGGDSAVILHPLSILTEYAKSSDVLNNIDSPKKVVFTARHNIIIINESNNLVYYNDDLKSETVFELKHESTYKLLSISSCRQLLAVADMTGKFDVFIENCKGPAILSNIVDTKLNIGKILSMHWISNRHIVFCTESGNITVLTKNGAEIDIFAKFTLPPSKGRWITSCALDKENLIVGDRCGNVHVFVRSETEPVKTFKKVHGRYGPTSINIRGNQFVTTGRDGSIKYFSLILLQYNSSIELDFQWVERFVHEERVVCGFQERVFVVYDMENGAKILEVKCGGGHRSWDVLRLICKTDDGFAEFISFMYIKDSKVHLRKFNLDRIVSRNIVYGTHSKEINCLKSHKINDELFFVSGGEDTTLRISSLKSIKFKDEIILKHLSNVRTVKVIEINEKELLLISAGGRAQICVKKAIFNQVNDKIIISTQDKKNYMIKGTDKERKSNWLNYKIDFDPETRVMDVETSTIDNITYNIYAGCSDACLRVFKFNINSNAFVKDEDVFYHKTCILKTKVLEINNKSYLITCTSFSEVAFWHIPKFDSPVKALFLHKSGINSIDIKVISNSEFLLATGGDDNTLILTYFKITDSIKEIHRWSAVSHCSQVTGVIIIDNLLLSTSIDQRVAMFSWSLVGESLKCEFVSQAFSDVADIQGMDLVENDENSVTVCVYGKGLEVLRLLRPTN